MTFVFVVYFSSLVIRIQTDTMKIGGLQKTSLIDYPDKISCVLFLSGCNFDCPFCHNPQLVRGTADCAAAPDLDAFSRFVEERRSFLEGVVVSGGEPTLQPDLFELCERLKQIGYPVKLDTNGSRPRIIHDLLTAGLVDYVAMDVKTDPVQYSRLVKGDIDTDCILDSIGIIMNAAPAYEFRTTCVKPLVSRGVIKSICESIRGADRYILQRFREENLLHPDFFCDLSPAYTEDELAQFQSMAAPYVKECIIR